MYKLHLSPTQALPLLYSSPLPALLEPEVSHSHGYALTLASVILDKVPHLSLSLPLFFFKLDVKFVCLTV